MNAVAAAGRPGPFRVDLSDLAYARIVRIAREEAGLALGPDQRQMVEVRIARYMRRAGEEDVLAMLRRIRAPDAADARRRLVVMLTTRVSRFFRERHHFALLASDVAPWLAGKARRGERATLWSAGCARGQEPYSIAMALLACWPEAASSGLRILGTDIDRDVLDVARSGRYTDDEIASVPDEFRHMVARGGTGPRPNRLVPEVRRLVEFREANLLEPPPVESPVDAIFCRNVMIYMAEPVRQRLRACFHASLSPGGWLFLGHSERLDRSAGSPFVRCGVTAYRKSGSA